MESARLAHPLWRWLDALRSLELAAQIRWLVARMVGLVLLLLTALAAGKLRRMTDVQPDSGAAFDVEAAVEQVRAAIHWQLYPEKPLAALTTLVERLESLRSHVRALEDERDAAWGIDRDHHQHGAPRWSLLEIERWLKALGADETQRALVLCKARSAALEDVVKAGAAGNGLHRSACVEALARLDGKERDA